MGQKEKTALNTLTRENYSQGFLIDEEWIAGITALSSTDGASLFAGYVSHYLTGETLDYKEFNGVDDALAFVNSIPRDWTFEGIGCNTEHGNSADDCGKSCGACGK